MNAAYENGYMVFSTDHFSDYVLEGKVVAGSSTTENPSTSNTTNQNTENSGNKNSDISNEASTSATVQNPDIPDTGRTEANAALYIGVAVSGAALFFTVACLRARKRSEKEPLL